MNDMYIKKNGLLYSSDGQTIIGVDDTSSSFSGHVSYGAKYIDDEVFSECPYESVVLPDSIKELGVALFKDSRCLESVKLPVFVTQLPVELFSGCSALTKIIMPQEVSGFSEGLFRGCESLSEIPFRAGIKVLPRYVFAGCSSIKSLVIPGSVEVIEEYAVADCASLESIVLPAGIRSIAFNAFEGCTAIHNIRISGENDIFYVKEEDGCLYRKSYGGDDLVIRSYKVAPSSVSYFDENVDDIPVDIADEDEEEVEDSFFGSEIGASDSESEAMGIAGDDNSNVDIEGDVMNDENNVDSMLADIMGEEKARTSVSEGVGISDAESEVLSETLSVMEDSSVSNGSSVSQAELEQLFSKNEEQEIAAQQSTEEDKKDRNELDSKTKILVDSVKEKKILTFDIDSGEGDSDLFVIAEKLVAGDDGVESFSNHLELCCSKMAKIHDFGRVIMLYGLPVDNDEFMQFYRHFIGKKNIILACEAERPSMLSDYCRVVCDNSRISLDSKEINEQRRYASVKTDNLVKLIVRDKYSN